MAAKIGSGPEGCNCGSPLTPCVMLQGPTSEPAAWRMRMAGNIEKKLSELGIVLAPPAAPVANYVPFVRTGNLLRPDLPRRRQARRQGPTGRRDLRRGRAKSGARLCDQSARPGQGRRRRSRQGGAGGAARRLRELGAGLPRRPEGDERRFRRDVAVFGEKGKHARTTVGVAALPLDAAIEVEALFEVS